MHAVPKVSREKILPKVVCIIKNFPPIPGPKLEECIGLVMDEISTHLRTEDDAKETLKFINKHVQRTHPVYLNLVSPSPSEPHVLPPTNQN